MTRQQELCWLIGTNTMISLYLVHVVKVLRQDVVMAEFHLQDIVLGAL